MHAQLLSVAFMVLGMATTISFDVRTHMEHGKPCFYRCCGFFMKLIKTVLHVRMAEEVYNGWKFLSQKFAPPVAVQVLKVSESLFEGVPQSLLQTYIIMKLAIDRGDDGREPTVTQYLSVASSVLGIGVAFATLGREPKPQWRLAFFLFMVVQALLRIVTLTLFVAVLFQQETTGGVQDAKRVLNFLTLKALYLLASFVACAVAVLLNVRPPAFERKGYTECALHGSVIPYPSGSRIDFSPYENVWDLNTHMQDMSFSEIGAEIDARSRWIRDRTLKCDSRVWCIRRSACSPKPVPAISFPEIKSQIWWLAPVSVLG